MTRGSPMPRLILGLFLVVFALVLTLVLGALAWNVLVASAHFAPLWAPPLAVVVLVILTPPFQIRFAALLYRAHGLGDWASSRVAVAAAWRRGGVRWRIFGLIAVLVAGWALVAPWSELWPGALELPTFFRGDPLGAYARSERIREIYDARAVGAVFFVALPAALAVPLIERLAQALVTRRVIKIGALLAGTAPASAELAAVDEAIVAAYDRCGFEKSGEHAAAFRDWLRQNVEPAIRDPAVIDSHLRQIRLAAEDELGKITACSEKYEALRAGYRARIAELTKKPSVALHGVLDEIGRALDPEALAPLLETARWADVDGYLEEVASYLDNVDELAAGVADEGGAAGRAGGITPETALEELGLPRGYTREDVLARRRQLFKIYHPDQALDDEQRTRNENRYKRVGELCDLLLDALS